MALWLWLERQSQNSASCTSTDNIEHTTESPEHMLVDETIYNLYDISSLRALANHCTKEPAGRYNASSADALCYQWFSDRSYVDTCATISAFMPPYNIVGWAYSCFLHSALRMKLSAPECLAIEEHCNVCYRY